MKKVILILIVFLSFNRVYSQEYYPLLGNSNTWYVLHSFEGSFTVIFSTKGDTLINEKEYKIFGHRDYTNVLGFIREDSINKQVFMLPNSEKDTSEIIFYDFTLEENDSIFLVSLNYDTLGYYRVDSIRTINTFLGSRKAFYLKGNREYSEFLGYNLYDYPIWIEGVGSLGSPEFRESNSDEWNLGELNCFFKNEEKLYQSEKSLELNDCNINIDGIDNFKLNEEISIYPNPANSILNIIIPNYDKYLLSVFDMFGRNLMQLDSPEIIKLDSFSDSS
jgi:hypothetical protein